MTHEPGPATAYVLSRIRLPHSHLVSPEEAEDWALRVEAAWRAMQVVQTDNFNEKAA